MVRKDGRLNPAAVRQVSAGSVIGMFFFSFSYFLLLGGREEGMGWEFPLGTFWKDGRCGVEKGEEGLHKTKGEKRIIVGKEREHEERA